MLKEYQEEISKLSFYPGANTGSIEAILCGALALNGEAGEVAEKVKKVWRDKNGLFLEEDRNALLLELGDSLFYITRLAAELGFSLEEVVEGNFNKILSRKERGTLQGSGDNR